MKKTLKRIILFVAAVPFFTSIFLWLPHYNYLSVTIILVFIGLMCGIEMRTLLAKVSDPLPMWTLALPALPPLFAWLIRCGWIPHSFSVILAVIGISWALIQSVFLPEKDIEKGLSRAGLHLLILIYPGWFLWWIAKLTWFSHAPVVLIVFMLTVFLNDSAAWMFGILFGKHRSIVPVSPNKSIEGFIAGIFSSLVVVFASSYIVPEVFSSLTKTAVILLGITAGMTTILGDLVESVLKRATGVKDSGSIVLGRGGMLDSIDSNLFTAPLFVIVLNWGGTLP